MPDLRYMLDGTRASAEYLAALIAGHRYTYSGEAELQACLAALFDRESISYVREQTLNGGDRPDFMVGSIAIEVKIAFSLNEVLCQLHRYSENEHVSAIILVTAKARHLRIPAQLNGKPIHIASLLEGAF